MHPPVVLGRCSDYNKNKDGENAREKGGRTLQPLTVQVQHAMYDGFNLCRFINGLPERRERSA